MRSCGGDLARLVLFLGVRVVCCEIVRLLALLGRCGVF